MGKGKSIQYIRLIIWIACLLPVGGIAPVICAQDTIPGIINTLSPNDTILPPDNMPVLLPTDNDSTIREEFSPDTILSLSDRIDSIVPPQENGALRAIKDTAGFKPNPKTAYLIAAIFPGFGQAYNRQYWKLPIVYGGLVGFMYAITWNNKVYQDYRRAYFDIRNDYNHYMEDPDRYGPDTWSTSWQDFTNRSPSSVLTDTNFHSRLQKGRDYYRRYRDLSIILSVAFYFICIADAYVDAQMFDFDISPDLSFRVEPEFYPSTLANSRSFGLNICMTF